ncbi:MAG: GtrA family protein [Gammaproteobacteria bacterium]
MSAEALDTARRGSGRFLRFGLVGTAGFVVDAAALTAAMAWLGLGPYGARVVSYLAAATVTWAMNRRFTFAGADPRHPAAQWRRFVAANSVGALVNYGTYAALLAFVPLVAARPVLGVAAGSVAGLVFNFTISKLWVFRAATSPPTDAATS